MQTIAAPSIKIKKPARVKSNASTNASRSLAAFAIAIAVAGDGMVSQLMSDET